MEEQAYADLVEVLIAWTQHASYSQDSSRISVREIQDVYPMFRIARYHYFSYGLDSAWKRSFAEFLGIALGCLHVLHR